MPTFSDFDSGAALVVNVNLVVGLDGVAVMANIPSLPEGHPHKDLVEGAVMAAVDAASAHIASVMKEPPTYERNELRKKTN